MEIAAVIWKKFVEYGILGVICFIEGWAIVRLWRENNALRDRYEAKSDKANEKILAMAERAKRAADAIEERRRSRRTTDVEQLHR